MRVVNFAISSIFYKDRHYTSLPLYFQYCEYMRVCFFLPQLKILVDILLEIFPILQR